MTRRMTLLGLFLVAVVACDDDKPSMPLEEEIWLDRHLPEHLILALEAIYNDKVRSATERLQAYDRLLAPPAGCDTCRSFLFFFNLRDEGGTSDVWGRDEEIRAHRGLFQAQDDGKIESLTLDIEFLPAEDLADPYRPGWKRISATNVHLRLLDGPSSGFEVVGGHALFRIYPDQGRWFIGEWFELPSQSPSVEVEPATWADIKAVFLR